MHYFWFWFLKPIGTLLGHLFAVAVVVFCVLFILWLKFSLGVFGKARLIGFTKRHTGNK